MIASGILIILSFLPNLLRGQITFTSYTNYPKYNDGRNKPLDIFLNENGTEIFFAFGDSFNIWISRYNVADPANKIYLGSYTWRGDQSQINPFKSIFVVKNYLIASSNSAQYPKVFNLSQYNSIGYVKTAMHFVSGTYIKSKDIIIFGTDSGKIGYVNVSMLPNTTFTEISSGATSPVYVAKSPDQHYLSAVYQTASFLTIIALSNFMIDTTMNLPNQATASTWTIDSRYLIVHPHNKSQADMYDRQASWKNINNITTAVLNSKACNSHIQTGTIMCLGENSMILLLNTENKSSNALIEGSGLSFTKMKVSQDSNVIAFFDPTSFVALFYQVNRVCANKTFYNMSTGICDPCSFSCQVCINTYICKKCSTNFTLVNTSCRACTPNQYYNTSTHLCDDVTNFCTADKYFNTSSGQCVQCSLNCSKCTSTTFCATCQINYVSMNGSCQICLPGTIYNSLTSQCDSCPLNCKKCTSIMICVSCFINYTLDNGACNTFVLPDKNLSVENTPQMIFQNTIANTIQRDEFVQSNKIPGSRIFLNQIFAFFVNFDHFWLYIYHNRSYGQYINDFFLGIRNLEDQKWSFAPISFVSQHMNINFTNLSSKLNFKLEDSSKKFKQVQGSSTSFFSNTLPFFILNLPLVLVIFICLRICFFIFFKYQISILFREYSFRMFLITILMEGNLQSFSFYFIFDCIHLHEKSLHQKEINLTTIIFFFAFTWYLNAWFFMVKYSQKQKTKYFSKHYQVNLKGLGYLTFQSNIFNLCLGAGHILLDGQQYQMIVLFSIQLAYVTSQAIVLRSKHVYTNKFIGYQNGMASFLRIILIFTFLFDKNSSDEIRNIYDSVQMIILAIYIGIWLVSVVGGYVFLICKFFRFLVNEFCFQFLKIFIINSNQANETLKINKKTKTRAYFQVIDNLGSKNKSTKGTKNKFQTLIHKKEQNYHYKFNHYYLNNHKSEYRDNQNNHHKNQQLQGQNKESDRKQTKRQWQKTHLSNFNVIRQDKRSKTTQQGNSWSKTFTGLRLQLITGKQRSKKKTKTQKSIMTNKDFRIQIGF